MTMSDRICLMNAGAIEQIGTPEDLYFRPRSIFVADFLGESNLLSATVRDIDAQGLDILLADQSAPSRAVGNGSNFAATSASAGSTSRGGPTGIGDGPNGSSLRHAPASITGPGPV